MKFETEQEKFWAEDLVTINKEITTKKYYHLISIYFQTV